MNEIKIITIMLLITVISIAVARADEVNLDIDVNGSANLNITIDADDTELREDVWGTSSQSDPRDVILDEISGLGSNPIEGTEGLQNIYQLCDDPGLQQYFNTLGNIPPDGFVQYLKGLGYDDEAHINFIWTVCQQKYIKENEQNWEEDVEGIEYENVADVITNAINWLLGNNPFADDYEKEVGTSLDTYFASDNDVRYLMLRINDLQLRVEALEHGMEEIAAEEHCEGKLKVLAKYGLKGVKCGDTTYLNHLQSPTTGEDVIFGITPVNGETQEPETEEYIPEASMDISPLNLPSKIKAYEAFELDVLVKNIGDAEGTDDITLILPEAWAADKTIETVTLDVSEATIIEFSITPNEKGGEISVSSSTDFEILAIVKPEAIMEFSLSPISEEQLNELSGLTDEISNTIKSFLTTMNIYTIIIVTVSSVLIYSIWSNFAFKPRVYKYKHKTRKRR